MSVTLTYPFLGPPDKTKEADSEKGQGNNKEEIVMTETKAATDTKTARGEKRKTEIQKYRKTDGHDEKEIE